MYTPKYFSLQELIQPHRNENNYAITFEDVERLNILVAHLDKVRELYGRAIKVNSGFRSKSYNSNTPGSSPSSLHVRGCACDISGYSYDHLRNVVLTYCNFIYFPRVTHYEDDKFEVILYPTKNFVHFAYKP